MDLSVDEAEHSMEMHLPYLAKVFQGYLNWPFAYVLCLDSILSKVHMRKESTLLMFHFAYLQDFCKDCAHHGGCLPS